MLQANRILLARLIKSHGIVNCTVTVTFSRHAKNRLPLTAFGCRVHYLGSGFWGND